MVYAGIPAKERKKRALKALERGWLSDRVKHRPNEISGANKSNG